MLRGTTKIPFPGSHRNNGPSAAAVVPHIRRLFTAGLPGDLRQPFPERPRSLWAFLSFQHLGQVPAYSSRSTSYVIL